jgi:uncharacterized protein (DUF885 family)
MKIQIFPLALTTFPGCWIANAADIAAESKRANEFFDKCWDETVARHPVEIFGESGADCGRDEKAARRIIPYQTEGDIVVKAVEKFRESSAGAAFYQQPAPDGSRPGMFYENLRNMHDQPVYELETLAHHQGIPGHHMQIAIAQDLTGIPKFRKLGARFTAYTEGWGLYCELTPKEIGMYQDSYSDFGRLWLELLRAARLVVDTGMHAKKWTRHQAIDYMKQNTPNSEGDCVDAINRHIVMPSQAAAYKIGMLKILELREKAKRALGARFDIRQFHDVVLTNGALPLDVLEDLVSGWTKSKQP